jgi:hypothetical protein
MPEQDRCPVDRMIDTPDIPSGAAMLWCPEP